MSDIVDDVQEVAEGVMQLGIKKSLGLAGILSGIFGFIADVLQPLAPFAVYLLIASSIILLLSLLYYVKCKKGLVISITSLCCAVVLGLVTILQSTTNSKEEGLSAKAIPGINELQQSLGLIDKKLDDIKQNTSEIKESTASIKSDTENISNKTNEIKENTDRLINQGERTNHSIDNLGEKIDGLANNGGIRKSPTTPEDFYANAKIYELNGDYGNAKRAYQAYFKFKTGKLDPHIRLTDFLSVNEGRSGARNVYNIIVRGNETPNSTFLKAILFPNREVRIEKLTAFNQSHPDFSPAFYYLSKEYSLDRLGKQSLADKRQEYKWLTAFKKADESGSVVKYFVDKELLSTWQSDVTSRLKLAEEYMHQLKNPVSVAWTTHNAGYSGYLTITEPTLSIEYREKGKGEFRSTGMGTAIDKTTGKLTPNPNISLPIDQQASIFEIRYTDSSGNLSDIYEVALEEKNVSGTQTKDGKVELDQNSLNMLNLTKTSWLGFQAPVGKTNLYFTHILAHRGLLKKIEYGIDTETPDTILDFPPYNKTGVAPVTVDMKLYQEVPKETKFATIRLTFKDDTTSEIVKFNNLLPK